MKKIIKTAFLSYILLWGSVNKLLSQESKQILQSISISHTIEHVSRPIKLDWQITSIEALLNNKTNDQFSIKTLPRINMGQRTGNNISMFEKPDFQYQIDNYLSFRKKINIFGSYGYSSYDMFAKHQATIEVSYSIGKGWNILGGSKLTYWKHTLMTYTVGVEKYVSNFWLVLKPSYITQSGDAFWAIQSNLRYYIKEPSNYLHLGLNYGNSPEYANYIPDLPKLLTLKSYGGWISFHHQLTNHLNLMVGISYRREEYKEGKYRNMLGAHTGITINL